ncbi:MAG: hypothetical protein Q4B80_00500 [Aerococcaceae bacterium]|nr:hypothetical protein [Aerococcaceae bacterium]
MKKRNQWLVSLLAGFALTGSALPVAHAEANPQEVVTKMVEAAKGVNTVHIAADMSAAFASNGLESNIFGGTYDIRADFDAVEFAFTLKGASPFSSANISMESYLKEDQLTVIASGIAGGETLDSEVVQQSVDGLSEVVKSEIPKLKAKPITIDVENLLKYAELTETDTEYVWSLRADADPAAILADMKAYIHFVKDIVKEYMETLKAQGEEVEEIDWAAFEAQLDQELTVDFVNIFLQSNPKIELHYDKETYLLKHFVEEMTFDTAELVKATSEEEVPEELLQTLPETVIVKMAFNYDNYNQPQNIEVPEVTVTPAEESSSAE